MPRKVITCFHCKEEILDPVNALLYKTKKYHKSCCNQMSKDANSNSKSEVSQKSFKTTMNTRQQIEACVKAVMRWKVDSVLTQDYVNQIDSLFKESVVLGLTEKELLRAVEDSVSEQLMREYYPKPIKERRNKGVWHIATKLLELRERRQQIEDSVQHNIAMLDKMKEKAKRQVFVNTANSSVRNNSINNKKLQQLKDKMNGGL